MVSEWAVLGLLYLLVVTITTGISGGLGQLASVIDSFFGIGLVIVLRARLHDIWRPRPDFTPLLAGFRMATLIALGALCTLAVNSHSPQVALGSGVAFIVANMVAGVVYEAGRSREWFWRMAASAVVFAAADSVIFPPIAFGRYTWWVVVGQFFAKIGGAVVWAWVLGRFLKQSWATPPQVKLGLNGGGYGSATSVGVANRYRALAWRAIIAWALLATIATIALIVALLHNDTALNRATRALAVAGNARSVADRSLRDALIHQCIATNVTRAIDNSSHAADYNVFLFIEQRFLIPTKTETAAQKAVTALFAARLRGSLASKTWMPLTNCSAVAQGAEQIKFYPLSQSSPPPYALGQTHAELANAAKPDPAGSIP